MMNRKFWLLCAGIAGLAVFFMLFDSGLDFEYVLPKRLLRLATILLAGICIAVSSVVFQTLVTNRILTPAIMGYEAVYLFWQVLLLFFLGQSSLGLLGLNGNFFASVGLMLFYSWLIHHYLLPRARHSLWLLLLFGMVLTMVITTLTQFIVLKISPGEFSVFQGINYASFNHSETQTLLYAFVAMLAVGLVGYPYLTTLDVMALGEEQSVSLGVDYARYVRWGFGLIAVLVAVSTSLVGPTAFMGVFIANMAYAFAGHYQHKRILLFASAVAIAVFLIAQILVEHVFNYKTTVSILINLICGVYFLLLIVRYRGMA
ncbi:MAG: iron chelate uptake ABC transporter family permease subunit [Snodgrassella alvi]|nr:iron chelate uptake ABC transporter family permease subunit [Snodgrassella alvi]MCT6884128.1 iron chelate uptake ABC transporter family permease subunit [Snodgrassella alvi]